MIQAGAGFGFEREDAATAKSVIAKLPGAFQIANVDKNGCVNALDVEGVGSVLRR